MDKNILLLFATTIAILPVFFIKKYILSNNMIYIILSIVAYIILIILYIELFKNYEISNNYVILQILQILLVIGASYLLYNEKLNNYQLTGVVMGISSIWLLY
jgi:multidrug transporter EmrE-like cation transporter